MSYDFGLDDGPKKEEPQAATAGDILKVAGKLSNWKTYVIYALLALVVVEGVVIIWQRGTVAKSAVLVAKADAKVTRITTERDIALSNEKSCRVNLADQNEKVGDAGKRYDRLKGEMDDLAKRIKDGEFYKPAEDVRKQPTPKSCDEALDFLNRNF